MHPLDISVSVGDIWQLALPPGTTLAGGESGLCREVRWVATLRATFPLFGSLEQGYLALARLSLARRVDAQLTLAYLLAELHRAQAAALVIDERPAANDAALADALGLPLLVLPPDADLHAAEREVLRCLVDREGQLARREVDAHRRLQAVYGRGGLQAMLDELARMAGCAVSLADTSGTEVARAGALSEAAPAQGALRLPVQVAERSLGWLCLGREADACTPLQAVYARQAAELAAVELLQRLTRQETEERLGAGLVEQMLDDEQEDPAITSRLSRAGCDVSPGRRYAVVATEGPHRDAASPATELVRSLGWLGQRAGTTVLPAPYHDHLLAICSFAGTMSERRLRAWLQEGLAGAHGRACAVGVSRIAADIRGLRLGVRQALDALALGRRIRDRHSPYHYDDLGLYRLLAGLRARDELRRFHAETLGALAQHDEAHGTELVRTLEAFFAHNANASRTSRALYVHRNTLNYRLQRIAEIIGLDLNDAEARLALQLALKVHQLVD